MLQRPAVGGLSGLKASTACMVLHSCQLNHMLGIDSYQVCHTHGCAEETEKNIAERGGSLCSITSVVRQTMIANPKRSICSSMTMLKQELSSMISTLSQRKGPSTVSILTSVILHMHVTPGREEGLCWMLMVRQHTSRAHGCKYGEDSAGRVLSKLSAMDLWHLHSTANSEFAMRPRTMRTDAEIAQGIHTMRARDHSQHTVYEIN